MGATAMREPTGYVDSEDDAAVFHVIDALVEYARERLLLDARDRDWMRNRLLELFDADESLRAQAVALAGQGGEAIVDGVLASDEVMGTLSAAPSHIQDEYDDVRATAGNMEAMRWLYDYCVANGSVKLAQLRRNVRFDSAGLVVTINTAKPEFKDMRKAARGNSVDGSFAQCTICHEN